MLDINYVRENFETAKQGLLKRNIDNAAELLNKVIKLDDKRKSNQYALDEVLAKLNTYSKEIGELFKSGKHQEGNALRAETTTLKEQSKTLQDEQSQILADLDEALLQIPNIPHESVVKGKLEEDNEIIRTWGDIPTLDENQAKPHWELATDYKIFDLELGVKLTGAGFPVFIGKGAKLQRGMINFFLAKAEEAGYTEIVPPLMVNADSARATGQLPDKDGQMYEMKLEDYYMIPTAEVPLTNIYRNEVLEQNDLPIKLTGYTPCFRREAGSYGAHVRGLNRLHQFDKVEIVQMVDPSVSYDVLEDMLAHVEQLVQDLELPYRVLRLCGGDLGFTSALTYDIEVYSAAQKRWLEVSSISNFETYQSNRLKLRYKNAEGKRALLHTLNGSALALPRIMAALLENNQTPKGIKLPKALHNYVGFDNID